MALYATSMPLIMELRRAHVIRLLSEHELVISAFMCNCQCDVKTVLHLMHIDVLQCIICVRDSSKATASLWIEALIREEAGVRTVM